MKADEKVEEIDNFDEYFPNSRFVKHSTEQLQQLENIKAIEGSSIIKVVEKLPDLQDFDETVEIVDSVVVDHVSEDDKSTSSEEVTYERWTEETKVIRTKIFKDGQLVDEIIEQSRPELVGNILREKLIERHEHIKHISQDVLKRIRVKSPGQSRRQSLDINEIINEDLDGSSIFIVEPTVSSASASASKRRNSDLGPTNLDNTYYIQHQQVITPSGQTSYISGTTKTSAYCSLLPANTLMHNIASEFSTFSSSTPFSNFTLLPYNKKNNNNHFLDSKFKKFVYLMKNIRINLVLVYLACITLNLTLTQSLLLALLNPRLLILILNQYKQI